MEMEIASVWQRFHIAMEEIAALAVPHSFVTHARHQQHEPKLKLISRLGSQHEVVRPGRTSCPENTTFSSSSVSLSLFFKS